MSKSNQGPSAAERRAQERQQRQNIQNQARNSGKARRYQKRSDPVRLWLLIAGGLVILILLVVVGSTLLSNRSQQEAVKSATPDVFHQITNLSPDLLNRVGSGDTDKSVAQVLKPVKNTPILKGPNGKPAVFFMSGEFCPFCGAQRWPLTIALSRFGTFDKPLTPILSGEDKIPTYSYYQHTYKSNYIDFVSAEVSDNTFPNPNALQALTKDQIQLVNTYDAPPYVAADSKGNFPFMSVGNQYVTTGVYFSPTLLVGTDYNQILTAIKDPTSDLSRAILGSANYITAQICQITQNQPGSVCNASAIPPLQQKLPKASVSTLSTTQLAVLDLPRPTLLERKSA